MTCGEYLALYSELLDERLDVEDELRCRTHVQECASCARYDRVMRQGLSLVRELPMITPSSQFLHRFQHRILNMPEGNGDGRFAASGTVLALAIAGVIAAAAWSPLLRLPDPVERASRDAAVAEDLDTGRAVRRLETAPAVPASWYDGPRAVPAVMLTGTRSWPASAVSSSSSASSGSFPGLAPSEPGPYSPLIVSPPLERAVTGGSPRPVQ